MAKKSKTSKTTKQTGNKGTAKKNGVTKKQATNQAETTIKSKAAQKRVANADKKAQKPETTPRHSQGKVLLSVKNVSYHYSDAAADEYALKNVSFDFAAGKLYAIKGRSGSGKTTLLSLISGLERCTEGEIRFDGKDLKEINLDRYRSSDIGIVFQSYNLLPFMTASENIILSMDVNGQKVANKKQEAVKLMAKVGLRETYADRKVLRLSGGEQQRVAIARSLSYAPKMIIADEPTGNLDKQTEQEILDIFQKLAHEEGKCVIIVTHSQSVCNQADEVYDLI